MENDAIGEVIQKIMKSVPQVSPAKEIQKQEEITGTDYKLIKWWQAPQSMVFGAAAAILLTWGVVSAYYSSGGSSSSTAAHYTNSEGPRCDGVQHTIVLGDEFQPARAGCTAAWGINDDSPSPCIYLYDAQQKIIPRLACRGNEATFAGIPSTGWKSGTNGVVAHVDVIFRKTE